MKQEIDYYGDKDNYIHLKFGEIRKMYNFTKEFQEKYPIFVEHYKKYWNFKNTSYGDFKNAFQVVSYIYNNKIPVNLYYNFTDTPVKNRKEVIAYLLRENNIKKLLD
jgi:hypothetical protein